jgi:hypothetical protein
LKPKILVPVLPGVIIISIALALMMLGPRTERVTKYASAKHQAPASGPAPVGAPDYAKCTKKAWKSDDGGDEMSIVMCDKADKDKPLPPEILEGVKDEGAKEKLKKSFAEPTKEKDKDKLTGNTAFGTATGGPTWGPAPPQANTSDWGWYVGADYSCGPGTYCVLEGDMQAGAGFWVTWWRKWWEQSGWAYDACLEFTYCWYFTDWWTWYDHEAMRAEVWTQFWHTAWACHCIWACSLWDEIWNPGGQWY